MYICIQASGWTALFIASKVGNVDIVQLLISRSASLDLKDKVTLYLQTLHSLPLDIRYNFNN